MMLPAGSSSVWQVQASTVTALVFQTLIVFSLLWTVCVPRVLIKHYCAVLWNILDVKNEQFTSTCLYSQTMDYHEDISTSTSSYRSTLPPGVSLLILMTLSYF